MPALNSKNLQDPSYVLSNMSYYFGNSAKDQHVQQWASNTAMLNTKNIYRCR